MKLRIKKSRKGEAYISLVGANGEIIMSGEERSTHHGATKTAFAIQTYVKNYPLIIEDLYNSGPRKKKTPGGVKK